MPAAFSVDAQNLQQVLAELRKIDPELRKELQREMKAELKPFAQKLGQSIPKQSPLSGMARGRASSPRWTWTSVRASVVTPLAKRAKLPGFYPVVSMRFRSGSKAAGYEIVEKARRAQSAVGEAFIRNLNNRAPIIGGLGRFVIPAARGAGDEAQRAAQRVLEKFAEKVNRRLK